MVVYFDNFIFGRSTWSNITLFSWFIWWWWVGSLPGGSGGRISLSEGGFTSEP